MTHANHIDAYIHIHHLHCALYKTKTILRFNVVYIFIWIYISICKLFAHVIAHFVLLVPYTFRLCLCASTISSNGTTVRRSQLGTKPIYFLSSFCILCTKKISCHLNEILLEFTWIKCHSYAIKRVKGNERKREREKERKKMIQKKESKKKSKRFASQNALWTHVADFVVAF